MNRALAWVDARPALVFLALLYVARLSIVYPLGVIQIQMAKMLADQPDVSLGISPLASFFLLFIAAPLGETLIECAVPYKLMEGRKTARSMRPWRFLFVSAGLLAILHVPVYGVIWLALAPGVLVTGLFLAYCYAHFASQSQARAFAYTALFHALINVLPFVLYDLLDK